MTSHRALLPAGWPRPKGYSQGIAATGVSIWLAGQIGWNEAGEFRDGLPAQVEQSLRNILTILAEADAGPADIVRLVWYIVSVEDYQLQLPEIGAAYRRVMGRNFPAMAVVEVSRLVERRALVEIEATAVR